ncbi:hypothetical protein T12_3552 [Trichinella patagoniensis]|uniref:Uncharacterized protein n=1 Tax=Trichinella patagoniensis TaxID=990121 RepID=A0A0V0ZXL8_9BILA|nr:hypothetical protein T12_15106 [Trichinella patagoniensis]KRY17371.1 hypothetical protein T12_3552 [Trichinella patagoniensis]
MQIKVLYANDQPIALICVSAIVMQITSATTPVNDPANKCPPGFASGAAPSAQFAAAVEMSTLPLACVGPLISVKLSLQAVYTTFGNFRQIRQRHNLHFILSRAQAHQVDGLVKQPHLALTRRYK